MEEEFMKFLRENIPCSEDNSNDCETSTDHKLESKESTIQMDPIKDIE